MTDPRRFPDPVWDRFFEFVFPCDEPMTRAEVQGELSRLGIDVRGACSKVQQALLAREAQAELKNAKDRRLQILEKLEGVIAPVTEGIRDNLRALISGCFKGTVQAAYFRRLESAATDADLQSMLDDIHKLEFFSEGQADEGTPTK